MTNLNKTLFDLLCDPAGWPSLSASVPPPPDELFMKSRLLKAWVRRGDLLIKVAAGSYTTDSFGPETLLPFTPEQIAELLQPHENGSLLDALQTPLPEPSD